MLLVIKNAKPVRAGVLKCTKSNITSDKSEANSKNP